MNGNCVKQPDGYRETIQRGIAALRSFRGGLSAGRLPREAAIEGLKRELREADAVVIGAGAGLSTAAGFTYSGERFNRWFGDFGREYGFEDMYTGGFYPFPSEEARWAYWARNIYVNRYLDPPKPVYEALRRLVREKDYFVITTNVDHCFQKAGFDKGRLFYTQGDYGLFQSVNPAIQKTFDNGAWVMAAMAAQGFVKNAGGQYEKPAGGALLTRIPTGLIPTCPEDGSGVTLNLRADDSFVEDAGWRRASAAYADFLRAHHGQRVLFMELGVGNNTPVIIKYPFWQMTRDDPRATYACLNYSEACCPVEIERQSLCIDGDTGEVLMEL